MKVIVAGSRSIIALDLIKTAIKDSGFKLTELVCGCSYGVDRAAERWALDEGIPVKKFPADWAKYGRAAGPIRNKEMAKYADALVLVWDGVSPGSKNMLGAAQDAGLKTYVITVSKNDKISGRD